MIGFVLTFAVLAGLVYAAHRSLPRGEDIQLDLFTKYFEENL